MLKAILGVRYSSDRKFEGDRSPLLIFDVPKDVPPPSLRRLRCTPISMRAYPATSRIAGRKSVSGA
jgi:hypothetical protein